MEKTTSQNAVYPTKGYTPTESGYFSDKAAPWLVESADPVTQTIRCRRLTLSGSNSPERLQQYMKLLYPDGTDVDNPYGLPLLEVEVWYPGDDPQGSRLDLARSRDTTVTEDMVILGYLKPEAIEPFLEACQKRMEEAYKRQFRNLRFTSRATRVKSEDAAESKAHHNNLNEDGPKDSGYESMVAPSMLPETPVANTLTTTPENILSQGPSDLVVASYTRAGTDGTVEDDDWMWSEEEYERIRAARPVPKNKGEAILEDLHDKAMTAHTATIFTSCDYDEAVEDVVRAQPAEKNAPRDHERYEVLKAKVREADQAHQEAMALAKSTEEAEKAARIPYDQWPPEWHEPVLGSPSVTMTD